MLPGNIPMVFFIYSIDDFSPGIWHGCSGLSTKSSGWFLFNKKLTSIIAFILLKHSQTALPISKNVKLSHPA